MKNFTYQLTLLIALFAFSSSFGQKAVVIGTNHATPDGFAFLVTQDLANGETVYFTEDEYDNSTNIFATGESVVRFTASGAVSTGTVIFVNETSTNTFSTSCCGTADHFGGAFALATGGEAFYSYQDTDTDPSNGVTEIYSVFYTGETGPGTGGTIPALLDPTPDFPNAIVVDGFPAVNPGRAEYQFAGAGIRDGLCRDDLENVSNYLHAQANQALSTIAFNSFTLACTGPTLIVSRSPASVAENSGSPITYTFTLSAAVASNTTVNFNVGGTATFSTDYSQSGAATFNASTGTVVINSGFTTANVTITPVGDTTLEPDETVILTATAGVGYTAGSPSSATATITNDDTLSTTPTVAVVGMNHAGTDGFSFVALVDIAAGTDIYFTEEEFNINDLAFSSTSGEAVMRWTAPAGGTTRGTVIVATESAANTFTTTCNGGTCGSVTVLSGSFATATNGEGLFAYSDTDTDPTNGVTEVHAVLYTGVTGTPGGNIPAIEDPTAVYTGAVVVDGFPAVDPNRTEYRFPPERGITVDQAIFQNTTNWFHAQANAVLSDVPFANIIISSGSANPTLTLAVAPGSSVEDTGVGMVYTFTLSAPAAAPITVNFTVGGTATLTTDYTTSGAATFTSTNGTATIPMGGTSVAVTVTPVVDAVVEPTETIELMIDTGTGYDGGSPNAATGSITNDDTSASDPLVAIMGMAHDGATDDAFSFAAAQNIPGSTVVYFTEDEFDNTNLLFSSGEAVVQWTSPAGQIDQGDVIVITETAPDTFTVTCSDTSGNGCGTATIITGSFALATNGETIYAYEDSDTDPTNGVDDIYSVMYTGNSTTPGGNIPAVEDPSGIYLQALVVDGFPAVAPDKTEYTPASRTIPVGMADFENPANYDHAFAYGVGLSTVPFASLSIVVTFTAPADLCVDAGVQAGLGSGTPTGGVYSGPGVTDDGNGMTYSFDPAAAGVGVHTITYTQGGSSASDDIEVFALPTVTFTAPADLCIDAGVQAGLGGGTPTGGVYSGAGVTDDGNGMTYSFDPAAAGVGTHTLTYTFTDTNGCTNSASDDIEVFALPTVTFTAPADLCVDAGVQAGLGSGTPTGGVYSGPGVTDDGNGMTYSFDPAAAGVGTHTITYTFTDTNGCSGSATDDVEVFDLPMVSFIAPADLCIDTGVQAGLGGGSPTGGVYSGAGVTDDGNGMTYSFDPAAAGPGTTTITYTFTDTNGCTNSASDDIEVFALPTVTFTAPADLCIDAGVQAGLGGGTPTGGVYSGPGVTDDGNGMTYSFDPAAAGVGTHTLTYTFTDVNGCTNSASDDIEVFALPTVTFTAPPSPICPNTVLTGLGGGTPTGGVYSGPGVTDDGNGMTFTFDSGAAGTGMHTITYTFTDTNGCTGSASDTVTVEDTTPPAITCPGDITVNNDAGVCGAVVTYTAPVGTDNCSGATTMQTAGLPSGSTFPVGTTTNTFLVTDGSGNTASCSFTVTVIDNENPMINCPADITVGNDPGVCGAAVTYSVTSSDNCPGETIMQTAGLASGSVFPVGTTTNTFIVTDAAGNTATCSFDVTVNDTENPTITCPADISVNNDPGVCGAAVTYSVTSSDNCPGETIMQTAGLASGSVFPVGTTTNTFVVTDAAGNTATCSFDVTVTDNEPPVAMCQDITVQLDANGMASITPGQIDNGSTDNCGIASLSVSPSAFDCTDVGANTVTLTVTDIYGNSSTCTATVTVEDNVPPVAMCVPDFTLPLDATGNASLTPMDIDNGSTDACGIASLSISPSSFDCSDVGPNVVTLTVTDVNGNVSTCTTTVTVVDVTPPVIFCPADVTATNDAGICGATVFFPDAIAIDECGIMSVTQTMGLPSGSVFPVGTTTIEFTATDVNGNSSTCTFDITVTDDEPPVAVCEDITIQLDANGMAMITPTDVDGGSTDNCAIASLSISQDTFDCSHVGMNNVILTVTDIYGNSSTCTAIVTVEDVTPPVAICMDITVELDINGTVTVDPLLVGGASTDACGIASMTLDNDTFTCADVGDNMVTLTVTDVNGNVSTCTAIITVEDNIAPNLVCMDITVELDENGIAVITPEDVIDINTDACGIFTTAIDIFEFDCSDIGTPVTVSVFSQDNNGNISLCMAEVTVVDVLAPEVTCPDDQTVDPGPGNLFYELPDYWANGDATAVDNCTDPVTITTQDPAPGTLLGDGTHIITLCATDEYGNEACCTFELTVESILGGADPANFGTLTLYPNPASSEIYLSNPKQMELDKVSIYDMTGRLVKTVNLQGMGSEKAIDISELASATYMFIINNEYGQMTKSIIKE